MFRASELRVAFACRLSNVIGSTEAIRRIGCCVAVRAFRAITVSARVPVVSIETRNVPPVRSSLLMLFAEAFAIKSLNVVSSTSRALTVSFSCELFISSGTTLISPPISTALPKSFKAVFSKCIKLSRYMIAPPASLMCISPTSVFKSNVGISQSNATSGCLDVPVIVEV